MNSYDPQKAARVWQRVQQTQEQHQEQHQADNWPSLIQEALNAQAVYQSLAARLPGQSRQLQQMSREEGHHAACLKGICRTVTGQGPKLQPLSVPREQPEAALRKCYVRELNRARDYQRRSADPEYGPVFRSLAAQEEAHCCRILELLGTLGG